MNAAEKVLLEQLAKQQQRKEDNKVWDEVQALQRAQASEGRADAGHLPELAERRDWNGMNWIRQEKRLALYLRDGLACAYCGEGIEDGAVLTLDHVLPVEKGGSNEKENLVTACLRCNSAKGKRNVREFIEATAAYLNHGVRAVDIHAALNAKLGALLPLARAKILIDRRGSAARAVRAMKGGQR